MRAKSKGYFATREFRYGTELVEPGQLFSPRGAPNDAALLSVGYLTEVATSFPTGVVEAQCVRCGKLFVDGSYVAVHAPKCAGPRGVSLEAEVKEPPSIKLPGEETDEV